MSSLEQKMKNSQKDDTSSLNNISETKKRIMRTATLGNGNKSNIQFSK